MPDNRNRSRKSGNQRPPAARQQRNVQRGPDRRYPQENPYQLDDRYYQDAQGWMEGGYTQQPRPRADGYGQQNGPYRRQAAPKQKKQSRTGPLVALLLLTFVLAFFVYSNASVLPSDENEPAVKPSGGLFVIDKHPDDGPETSPPPEEYVLPTFEPHCVESTTPSKYIEYTNIMVNDQIVESYTAETPIDFGLGSDYTDVEGIVTFRGNNFRDEPTYGTANIVNGKFDTNTWNVSTGSLTAPDNAYWSGSGWVGQPLMMAWPKEMRQHMNMYDWAKNADHLVEVIYATMDGNIYFMELESGEKTRDPMYLGYTFKGAGALDPRGLPIMYLGSGYDSARGRSHVFIINLLDCSVMYEFGAADGFSLRGSLSFFDGSALVDAETDQLIYPGESGILYIIRLNTSYDPEAGTVSIAPSDVVKWRYKGIPRGFSYSGMEDSAVIWRGHIFMSTNDGYLFCINLNTLETVWVQDVVDDTNCSPVLELDETGHPYLYISTSFRYGIRSTTTATIPIWKIDAVTGEVMWHTDYECYSDSQTSGGVQGTLALGKNQLSDLIFVPVAKTPYASSGKIVALNKQTGEVAWEQETQMYIWSSPVAVYDSSGKGYIIVCTTGGFIHLMDGLTGTVLDSMDLGSNIEASPAVFNGNIVIGTRATGIYGIKLT